MNAHVMACVIIAIASQAGRLPAAEAAVPSSERPPRLTWASLPDLPDARGVAGPFAGVSGDTLIVAGGANFPNGAPWEGGRKVWYGDLYVLTDPSGTWKKAGRLPRPLAYGVSVTTPRGVVCAGGCDGERNFADVFLLTWAGDAVQIQSLPSLPRPCANACGDLIGETLYVAGGEEAANAVTALRTFWSLDLADAQARWQELPAWPGPGRTLAMGGALAGSFFLAGGVSLSAGTDGKPVRQYLKDAYAFKSGVGWRRVADMPHPVAAAPTPMPSVGVSQLAVLGGDDGSRYGAQPPAEHPGFSAAVLIYEPDGWRQAGETPAPRVTVPAVRWKGGWVIPSGEVRPGVRSPKVMTVR